MYQTTSQELYSELLSTLDGDQASLLDQLLIEESVDWMTEILRTDAESGKPADVKRIGDIVRRKLSGMSYAQIAIDRRESPDAVRKAFVRTRRNCFLWKGLYSSWDELGARFGIDGDLTKRLYVDSLPHIKELLRAAWDERGQRFGIYGELAKRLFLRTFVIGRIAITP